MRSLLLSGAFLSAIGATENATAFAVTSVPEALQGQWELLSQGPWGAREGLMVASVNGELILTGGRGTYGLGMSGGADVWRSKDGKDWTKAPEGGWSRRAYHIIIGPDASGCVYIMGGQTFSSFYNDVWKTCDAANTWSLMTESADWKPRAGLGGTMHKGRLFISGGCHDDVKYDPGAFRQFYGDVWSSTDGKSWDLVTDAPGWKARSGPRLVSFQDKIYIIAGEVGFTTSTQLGDVWSSSDDGKTWIEMTAAPAFSARSGHGVVTFGDYMILIAGWPELSDLYYTKDGTTWNRSDGLAWNCNSTACGKFDFWPLVHSNRLYTFGGSGSSSTFGKLYSDTWALDLSDALKEHRSVETAALIL